MVVNADYDRSSPESIEAYARKLIGHTFADVIAATGSGDVASEAYGNLRRKGGLGNLLEEYYFGYKANSNQEADFAEAGVELKVTPYEKTRTSELRAGERVVITMISFDSPVEKDFYASHLWDKIKLILFIYYWRNRELEDNLLYPISFAKLFTPPASDLAIIKADYQAIIEKIEAGLAHEISESDTLYLGACTKGATAEKSLVPQYYNPAVLAKRRAFCYKTSYMTYILNEYIAKDRATYEPIIKDVSVLEHQTFGSYVCGLINRYVGKTDEELCAMFGREYDNNKAQWVDLTFRMLGIRSNQAEEFKKANIVVKAIRLEADGRMVESMSFPPFRYKELIQETWEDSTLHDYFEEHRFLFVVFKSNGLRYVLRGCQLWNMPYADLNETVRKGWEQVRQTIRNGVVLTKVPVKGKIIVQNNFPKKEDNRIVHVRPHASKRYFKFEDGTILGDGTPTHANELPDGRWMPNYSFWINNSYILEQLNPEIK